jgi:hypothetical protein
MMLWGKHDQVTPIEDPRGTARLLAAFYQQTIGGRPA